MTSVDDKQSLTKGDGFAYNKFGEKVTNAFGDAVKFVPGTKNTETVNGRMWAIKEDGTKVDMGVVGPTDEQKLATDIKLRNDGVVDLDQRKKLMELGDITSTDPVLQFNGAVNIAKSVLGAIPESIRERTPYSNERVAQMATEMAKQGMTKEQISAKLTQQVIGDPEVQRQLAGSLTEKEKVNIQAQQARDMKALDYKYGRMEAADNAQIQQNTYAFQQATSDIYDAKKSTRNAMADADKELNQTALKMVQEGKAPSIEDAKRELGGVGKFSPARLATIMSYPNGAKQPDGRGQCGMLVNDYLGEPGKFGNTLADKTRNINAFAPKVGAVLVQKVGNNNVGHVAIVTAVNADGSFSVKESNWKGDERISERTLNSSDPSVLGFYDNTNPQTLGITKLSEIESKKKEMLGKQAFGTA